MRQDESQPVHAAPVRLRTNFPVVPITEVPAPGSTADTIADRPVVLVVDDEPVIADTLVEILKRSGYAAIAAYDGEDALETALLMPPEMVITDVLLPGISGIEVATTLRRKLPECKIMLLSGQAGTSTAAGSTSSLENGFEVIDKPVHPTDLLAKVSATFKSRKGHPQESIGRIAR
jgi:DNA-binding response OmpR family regulator